LESLNGRTDFALTGSCEHFDQLRFEARRERSARAPFGIRNLFEIVNQACQCDSIAAIGGEGITSDLLHSAVMPLKEPPSLIDRVDHVGNLERLCKEIVMDKQVMVREKDAKAGMGMVPADDVKLGKSPVALTGDFFP